MTDLRMTLGMLLACTLVAATARAADLPRQRDPVRHRPVTRYRPLPPVARLDGVMLRLPLVPPPRLCDPGYSPSAAGPCLRHGDLKVTCRPDGSDCRPLPPNPIPYGLGPYLRVAY